MRSIILLSGILLLLSCKEDSGHDDFNAIEELHKIEANLDSMHLAAAQADYEKYFSFFSSNAAFIGTDATENWQLDSFKTWAKPYFDKGKAWSFKSLQKTIYFSNDKSIAWFDELLDTRMKLCRGSGVFQKEDNSWKLKHYVLSMTIPNDSVQAVIKIKTPIEDSIIRTFGKQ